MTFGLYNPEKPFTKSILESIQKTWSKSVFKEAGYPIIKKSNGYLLEHVDGIGTKGYLHWLFGSFEAAAIDAFAMNVNDLAILGFNPKTLNCHLILQEEKESVINSVIRKLSELCLKYNTIFTGGETAILNTLKGMEIGIHMTGFTHSIINNPVKAGDLIYGHLSTGIHSNGLSMARRLLDDSLYKEYLEELTIPTAIYLDILEKTSFANRRMHITGGAFTKLRKLMSHDLDIHLDFSPIKLLEIFEILYSKLNELIENPSFEMLRTFNCGIGFIEIIHPRDKERFEKHAPNSKMIGEVLPKGNGKIKIISPFDEKLVEF
ncbi:MAG: AIR synthase related protein [Candidatus Hodarchaeales archaeon]|jgi:phosphoribosylformylglycinamidine cyclo-ligase